MGSIGQLQHKILLCVLIQILKCWETRCTILLAVVFGLKCSQDTLISEVEVPLLVDNIRSRQLVSPTCTAHCHDCAPTRGRGLKLPLHLLPLHLLHFIYDHVQHAFLADYSLGPGRAMWAPEERTGPMITAM